MLVVSRKRDEIVRIGHDIEIMVVRIGHGNVRLGISAPPDVTVHRQEVYEAIYETSVGDDGSSPDEAGE